MGPGMDPGIIAYVASSLSVSRQERPVKPYVIKALFWSDYLIKIFLFILIFHGTVFICKYFEQGCEGIVLKS